MYLEYLDLLLVVRESDLLLPVTLRQVDALAWLPLFIPIFEVEIFKVEVSLLAPIKSSFLHQDALLGHLGVIYCDHSTIMWWGCRIKGFDLAARGREGTGLIAGVDVLSIAHT